MTLTFDPIRHRYLVDGVEKPGPSKILQDVGISDPSHYAPGSAQKGRERHEAIFLVQRGLVPPSAYDGMPEAPYVKGWLDFVQAFGFLVDTQEVPRVHAMGTYCGTPDITGSLSGAGDKRLDGVLDIKTGGMEEWHGVQLAAYRDLTGLRQGWILQITDAGRFVFHDKWKGSDGAVRLFTDPYWARVWVGALTVYQWEHGKEKGQ